GDQVELFTSQLHPRSFSARLQIIKFELTGPSAGFPSPAKRLFARYWPSPARRLTCIKQPPNDARTCGTGTVLRCFSLYPAVYFDH
ncbi:hypothetical protein RCH06_003454, partial [Polaromonas sp. CG_9.5]|uniref:hypothetical protein n=1 Tax=Polaromonas sp. CG_9.5 TaxID=3071705 RepID=UPI002DFF28D7|nr:hypothetical protein [Polaromonas sp. CG_9.5]